MSVPRRMNHYRRDRCGQPSVTPPWRTWAGKFSKSYKLTGLTGSRKATPFETPTSGDWTAHNIILWAVLAPGAVATALSMLLIAFHATHYSRPQEQKP